jgi:oligosaccharide repeat unit polymerase
MDRIKLFSYIFGLIIFAFYTNYYLIMSPESSYEACCGLGIYVIIQLVFSLYTWKIKTGSYFSAYTVFLIAFYMFNLGQVVLDYFGLEIKAHTLLNGYLDQKEYFDAAYISLGSLLFFHFGGLMSLKTKDDRAESNPWDIKKSFESIFYISLIFALLSAPFYFYNLFIKLDVVALYGYDALYDSRNTTSYFATMLADFYSPALISLYFSSEYLKRKKNVVLSILVLTILLPPLLLGGRANAGIIIAIIVLIYSLFHKIKTKQAIVGVILGLFFINIFNLIADTRNNTNKSATAIAQSLKEEENPLVKFLSETGFSMYPLGETTSLVPKNRPYEYGATYLWEMTTVIPNFDFWDLHPAQKHDPGAWLQVQAGHSFGIGYSLIAEAYHNFGYFGFLFMILNGYLYSLLLIRIGRKEILINPLLVALALMFLWSSIKGVRSSFQGVVRGLMYYSLIPYYFMYLYKKHRYKK